MWKYRDSIESNTKVNNNINNNNNNNSNSSNRNPNVRNNGVISSEIKNNNGTANSQSNTPAGKRSSQFTAATFSSSDTEFWLNQQREKKFQKNSLSSKAGRSSKKGSESSNDTAYWVNQKRDQRKQSNQSSVVFANKKSSLPVAKGFNANSSNISKQPDTSTQAGSESSSGDTDYWLHQLDQKRATQKFTNAEPEVKVYSMYGLQGQLVSTYGATIDPTTTGSSKSSSGATTTNTTEFWATANERTKSKFEKDSAVPINISDAAESRTVTAPTSPPPAQQINPKQDILFVEYNKKKLDDDIHYDKIHWCESDNDSTSTTTPVGISGLQSADGSSSRMLDSDSRNKSRVNSWVPPDFPPLAGGSHEYSEVNNKNRLGKSSKGAPIPEMREREEHYLNLSEKSRDHAFFVSTVKKKSLQADESGNNNSSNTYNDVYLPKRKSKKSMTRETFTETEEDEDEYGDKRLPSHKIGENTISDTHSQKTIPKTRKSTTKKDVDKTSPVRANRAPKSKGFLCCKKRTTAVTSPAGDSVT